MVALSNVEIGSVVYNMIENVPTSISGNTLNFMVNVSTYTAENYTGVNIPVNAIADQYQPAIINLTIGQVLGQMEAQGIGTKSVKIGELNISKGMQEGTSKSFNMLAMTQLKDLGGNMSFYQAWN